MRPNEGVGLRHHHPSARPCLDSNVDPALNWYQQIMWEVKAIGVVLTTSLAENPLTHANMGLALLIQQASLCENVLFLLLNAHHNMCSVSISYVSEEVKATLHSQLGKPREQVKRTLHSQL